MKKILLIILAGGVLAAGAMSDNTAVAMGGALASLIPSMRKLNPSGKKAPVHPVTIAR